MLNTQPFNNFPAVLLVLLLSLTGCASPPVSFNSQQLLADDHSVVFIYRPDAMANIMVTPDIQINGTTAFTLGNNQYQVIQLPAGQHHFKLELPERYQGASDITLDTLNGNRYFLRVDTAMKFQQNRPYDRYFNLRVMDESEALAQISLCRPAADKHANKPDQTPSDKESGYSSQSFRNPFSR